MKRLKGKKQIEILFEEGRSINAFPFRLIFLESSETAIGMSVGKKNFKLAVDRNRIKRQMREAAKEYLWPLLKESANNYRLMLIFTGKQKPEWEKMIKEIKIVAEKFKQKTL